MSGKPARGLRKKTRAKYKRKGPQITVNTILQEIPAGEKVHIKIDPSVHSGMPPSRYHGLSGTVKGKRGRAYEVEVKLGNQKSLLVIHSVHLKTQQSREKVSA